VTGTLWHSRVLLIAHQVRCKGNWASNCIHRIVYESSGMWAGGTGLQVGVGAGWCCGHSVIWRQALYCLQCR
jgi:hypothetical protein